MNDFERIRAVKRAAQAQLFSIPGVHSVAIGVKYVDGQNTGESAIIVFVVKKKPLSELPPYEVVPPEIDGVKTDVVEEERPVLHTDDTSTYRPLVGGAQVRAGLDINGAGTLGCIAQTDDPDPKIVAITCRHVVMWNGKPTDLIVTDTTISPSQHTFTFSGSNTPGSLVVVRMSIQPTGSGITQNVELFWVTDDEDTPEKVAAKVASGISGLGNPGVSAIASGAQVTITTGPNLILRVPDCFVYDVRPPDPSADLQASVVANVITLSGQVSGEYYGVYISVHTGDGQPSRGVFTSPAKREALDAVASSIANAINNHISGITATASGMQITIANARYIECIISSDVRVGQPDNIFCSKCSACCDQRIGRIIDARLDIDTALIQLDPGQKYKAEIKDIGPVTGTHTITPSEVRSQTYQVKKYGRTTGSTLGTVYAVDADGDASGLDVKGPPDKALFRRYYTGAMIIKSTTSDPFSQGGDSGSAVVNTSGEVIGILFGGGPNFTFVTPIDPILTALKIRIATATSPGIVQTVPTHTGAHVMPTPVGTPALVMTTNSATIGIAAPLTHIEDRLRTMEREITAIPAGKEYAALVRRHFPEVNTLVNSNRRVATVWHRNGGPQLIQRLIQVFQRPDEALPIEIDGKPLTECLTRIQEILMRYGSPLLSADLRTYGPGLRRLVGLAYPQILLTLQTWEGE